MASRFETAAEPDTILVSHETYSLIKDEIDCEYVSELSLKGIGKPVKAYKVLGEKDKKRRVNLIAVNEEGLKIKSMAFDEAELDEDVREELIRSLNIALHYTKGKIRRVYDKKNDEWKLVKPE